MANIEILTAEDTLHWHRQLLKVGIDDVYFFPEYPLTFNSVERGTSYLFCFEDGQNSFIYPFRLRRVSLLEQFKEFSDWFDITSDYGYGGPIVYFNNQTFDRVFVEGAIAAFDEFCKKNQIVTEFCRFHPILKNADFVKDFYKPIFCNQTVWVDLTVSEDECWRRIRENHRRDIRKAKEYGVKIEISDVPESVDIFHDLYTQSMEEVGASQYYFFCKKFFEDILALLSGKALVFQAVYQGKVIASALYIHGNRFLHYHFGGMDRKFSNIRANKLLHYSAIMWGKAKGLIKLHLGGGLGGSDTDPLMHFKAGFSSLRTDFYIAKRIHNTDIYRQLCNKVNVDLDKVSFFPAYRAH